ncbi:MAG: hypothetical protein P8J87_16010, partial [Verrucomicrobiales bacterium]|nr:hypothetical protein [Verrucomicrobiales bacterium]
MRTTLKILVTLAVSAAALPSALAQHVFSGSGNWLEVERWDQGVLPPDGSTAIIAGEAAITENTVPTQTANPGNVLIGDFDDGSLTVSGGTLSGAHGGGGGVVVGSNGGTGTLIIEPGATYRSQGANMRLQIGDDFGGSGFVSIAGEFQNYKYLQLISGTLEMQPTGINNKFNSNDPSFIGPAGNLAYVIDGATVGTISRSNTNGLNLDIDPAANLLITLTGNFAINDSWTLLSYTSLTGQFAQGTSFTNSQGYTFSLSYGGGFDDTATLTLTGDDQRPKIDAFSADPAAVSAGEPTTLSWNTSNFDSLTLSPGDIDVSALGETTVNPTTTTTYTLTAALGAVTVTTSTTVVVDELPEITSFTTDRMVIAPGEQATLNWNVAGADSIDIPPLSAPFAGYDLVGSRQVEPTETTTYTLNASNATGTVSQQVEVVVDAIESALIHRFDPAAPGQSSGALLDSIGTKNYDMTGGNLVTGITSDNTPLTTAMDRLNQDANTGGDNGDGFPTADTTFELWVRPTVLDLRPQVIFETGSPADGTCIVISQTSIRLLHSSAGFTTIDIEIPT